LKDSPEEGKCFLSKVEEIKEELLMEYKELRRRYENIFFEGRKDIEYNEE
jgi:hypothetical protein